MILKEILLPILDLLLINPGGRERIYQSLGGDLTAIEPPLWARLIAGYIADRGFSVGILDSEAEALGPDSVARKVEEISPRLIGMVVFGHQPSASTQQMVSAGENCRAIKNLTPQQQIIILGGHVSALPERTLQEEAVDYACNGEGPATVHQLLMALSGGQDLSTVQGLVWRQNGQTINNPPATLIKDLDADLHGNVWDLLPMDRYRAHNWQCFGKPGFPSAVCFHLHIARLPIQMHVLLHQCSFRCEQIPHAQSRRRCCRD
jgi:radical SAM superfamily enzyme YgiQ (UPF0313 family)